MDLKQTSQSIELIEMSKLISQIEELYFISGNLFEILKEANILIESEGLNWSDTIL